MRDPAVIVGALWKAGLLRLRSPSIGGYAKEKAGRDGQDRRDRPLEDESGLDHDGHEDLP